ncbi:hypothetical protein [Kamptonema formosum]|uniref:hypothetical protein n=1 Tax=Kamptonema formosum TaxID=331992 RepID=UPI00034CA611|nr:hypothetical protein [Oscillatoria sp. PCC 10802]
MKLKNLGTGLAAAGLAIATAGLAINLPASARVYPAQLAGNKPASVEVARSKASIKLGEEFQLKINQQANLNAEKIKVWFLRVVADSRCPANARCITAGRISIAVKIVQNNQDLGETILTLDPGDPKLATQTFGGNYAIQLLDVQPYPLAGGEIKPAAYRVKLTVTKAS